jgi:isochorismate synthase
LNFSKINLKSRKKNYLLSLIKETDQASDCFAFWKTPESDYLEYVEGNCTLVSMDEMEEQSFIVCPFDYRGKVLAIRKGGAAGSVDIFASDKKEKLREDIEFKSLVSRAIRTIQEGKLEKVVLSRKRQISQAGTFDSAGYFIGMLDTYASAFLSLVKIGAEVWIGASPELLFENKGTYARTMALAGTFHEKPRLLSRHYKELQEQEIVGRYIRDILKERGISIRESKPYVVQAGNIFHIRTDFDFVQNTPGLWKELIRDLHPTPAICGYPKAAAMAFIAEHENFNRQWFGGFLGPYYNDNACMFFVNLRCMCISEQSIHIFAGAGITRDSNPENELCEINNKMATLTDLLS